MPIQIDKDHKMEVVKGLALTEYLNKAFGDDFAKFYGNGTTKPHMIIIASECEMLVKLTEAYNKDAEDRWIKTWLEKQEEEDMLS